MPVGSFCNSSRGYQFIDGTGGPHHNAAEALGPTFLLHSRPCVGCMYVGLVSCHWLRVITTIQHSTCSCMQ